jgi:hypothetical protein
MVIHVHRLRLSSAGSTASGTVVGQYDARGVAGLTDQHTAIHRDPADQLGVGLLVLGPDVLHGLLRVVRLHNGEAAAPEAGTAEPSTQDARGLQQDLVQLDHLFAPCDFKREISHRKLSDNDYLQSSDTSLIIRL